MIRSVPTLKLAAVLASTVVSSYAVFGHDAWAPEPARLSQNLSGSTGATAAAVYVNTGEPTTVFSRPSTWTAAGPWVEAGRPCATGSLPEGWETTSVIERTGNYVRCAPWTWITPGVRLNEALSGIESTASGTDLATEEATTVVQFPGTWTYNTTLAVETYCATLPLSAGNLIGSVIVRFGDYAKCSL
jgi:hypothetical protein